MFGMNEQLAKTMLLPIKKKLIKDGVQTVAIQVLPNEELAMRAFKKRMLFLTEEQLQLVKQMEEHINSNPTYSLFNQIIDQNNPSNKEEQTEK